MTAAWIFDALPGLLALVVAGVAYFGTRRFVMRARSTAAEAQAAPDAEPAPASAEAAVSDDIYARALAAMSDVSKAHEASALAAVSDVSKAHETYAMVPKMPTLFATETPVLSSRYLGLGLGHIIPEGGVLGAPFNLGKKGEYWRGPDFFADYRTDLWGPGPEADVHPTSDISPERGMEELLRALESNRRSLARLAAMIRTSRTSGAVTPEESEEAKERS